MSQKRKWRLLRFVKTGRTEIALHRHPLTAWDGGVFMFAVFTGVWLLAKAHGCPGI